jgi:hypothetical protein
MIIVRGANGTAAIRVLQVRQFNRTEFRILNNGTKVTMDRSTDATVMAGLQALIAAVVPVTGPPTLISDLPEIT